VKHHKNTLHSLHVKLALAALLFFTSCTKEKLPAPKEFHVKIPLAEEYPLLREALNAYSSLYYPNSDLFFHEGLDDEYVLAPFDEWVGRSTANGIFSLNLSVTQVEHLEGVSSFLKAHESKIPFKLQSSFSSSLKDPLEESLFCRMKIKGSDLFEKQLCGELFRALCPAGSASSTQAPTSDQEGVFCYVKLNLGALRDVNPRELFMASFPLPLKTQNDYPFLRLVDFDSALWLSLFAKKPLAK
jgi:hypothetical protein